LRCPWTTRSGASKSVIPKTSHRNSSKRHTNRSPNEGLTKKSQVVCDISTSTEILDAVDVNTGGFQEYAYHLSTILAETSDSG